MRNFFNLYINENIKIFKKKSTIVFIILIILTVFASAGITYSIKMSNNSSNESLSDNSSNGWKSGAQQQIDYLKENLKSIKEGNKNIHNNENNLKAQIEVYEYAIDNDINFMNYSNKNWKIEVINILVNDKTLLYEAQSQKDNYTNLEIIKMNENIEYKFNLLKLNNFEKYIDDKIKLIEENYKNMLITEDQKNRSIEIENLTKKYQIGKEISEKEIWKETILYEIVNAKMELSTGINIQNNAILTVKEKQNLNENITIDIYRLENNIASNTQNSSPNESGYHSIFQNMEEILGMSIIGLFIIVIAGGSISQEVSKGTIKFLVITPSKRWKILFAKILTYTVLIVLLTIIISLLTILVGNIFFAGYPQEPYIFIKDGQIQTIGNAKYEVLRFLTYDIDIIIYMLFAVMFSVITKNTAIAVGFSIALYIGNSIFMSLLNMFVKSEWIKFIPFNSMNLTDKIFSNSTSIMQMTDTKSMNSLVNNISINFSLCVLGVCILLMIITAFDSFNNKDIT